MPESRDLDRAKTRPWLRLISAAVIPAKGYVGSVRLLCLDSVAPLACLHGCGDFMMPVTARDEGRHWVLSAVCRAFSYIEAVLG